jgi:hypothetical protein
MCVCLSICLCVCVCVCVGGWGGCWEPTAVYINQSDQSINRPISKRPLSPTPLLLTIPPPPPPLHTHTHTHIKNNQSHLEGSPWKDQFEKKRAAMNHVLKEIMPPVLAKFKGKLGVDDVGAFWVVCLVCLCVCLFVCLFVKIKHTSPQNAPRSTPPPPSPAHLLVSPWPTATNNQPTNQPKTKPTTNQNQNKRKNRGHAEEVLRPVAVAAAQGRRARAQGALPRAGPRPHRRVRVKGVEGEREGLMRWVVVRVGRWMVDGPNRRVRRERDMPLGLLWLVVIRVGTRSIVLRIHIHTQISPSESDRLSNVIVDDGPGSTAMHIELVLKASRKIEAGEELRQM